MEQEQETTRETRGGVIERTKVGKETVKAPEEEEPPDMDRQAREEKMREREMKNAPEEKDKAKRKTNPAEIKKIHGVKYPEREEHVRHLPSS